MKMPKPSLQRSAFWSGVSCAGVLSTVKDKSPHRLDGSPLMWTQAGGWVVAPLQLYVH